MLQLVSQFSVWTLTFNFSWCSPDQKPSGLHSPENKSVVWQSGGGAVFLLEGTREKIWESTNCLNRCWTNPINFGFYSSCTPPQPPPVTSSWDFGEFQHVNWVWFSCFFLAGLGVSSCGSTKAVVPSFQKFIVLFFLPFFYPCFILYKIVFLFYIFFWGGEKTVKVVVYI